MSAFPQIQAEGSPDPLLASAAFEACAESLAIVAKGRVLYANRAFARTFGFLNAFELQGRLLCDFLPPECLFNAAAPAPKTGFASTCAEGMHLTVSCAGFRLAGTDYLIINARDIREQKQAEQHARESQKLETIGRLVGGVGPRLQQSSHWDHALLRSANCRLAKRPAFEPSRGRDSLGQQARRKLDSAIASSGAKPRSACAFAVT